MACLEESGPLATLADALGIRVVALGKRSTGVDWRLVPALAALIRSERIDVVHTHNMGPLVYGSLAARLAGRRAVLNTRHGREAKRSPGLIWRLNGAVVAISEDARRRMLAINRLGTVPVRVIYNGINCGAFNPSTRPAFGGTRSGLRPADDHLESSYVSTGLRGDLTSDAKCALNFNPGRPLIGTVGRLAPEKDYATLLRAVAALRRTGLDAELALVGDGAMRRDLEQLASELGIGGRVRFLGYRTNIRALLAAFDVFTLSSLTEGIALTLLEAMAAGKPVVATRAGGNPEVVVEGETGLLVEPGRPEALAEALGRVLSDPALARRLGEAGRRRVETCFAVDRMVQEYVELYATLNHHEPVSERP